MTLPMNGRPFGPGGSGMEYFRRLKTAHANMAVISTKAVPMVGLKAMVSAQNCLYNSTLQVSNMISRCATLRQGNVEDAKGLMQKASDKTSIRLFDQRAEHCCGAYKVGYVALTLESHSRLN